MSLDEAAGVSDVAPIFEIAICNFKSVSLSKASGKADNVN
jgi:hypothetical protein